MKPLDFMIIGAQKSGTTALASFLDEHMQLEVSDPKEVHLFDDPECFSLDNESITGRYRDAFSDEPNLLRGEATPIYLYFPETAIRLREYNSELKIIVILRDPVARAYSHYRMEYERGNEWLPYWRALLAEAGRLRNDPDKYAENSSHRRHSYRDRGCYTDQLLAIYAAFPSRQVLVINHADLRDSHKETLARVFEFLGVPNISITAREVFSGGNGIDEVPFTSWLLRLSYKRERSRLKLLLDFDVSAWS